MRGPPPATIYTKISFGALYSVDAVTRSPHATGSAALDELFTIGEWKGAPFTGDCLKSLTAMRDDGTLDVQAYKDSWSASGWDEGEQLMFYINGAHVLKVTHGMSLVQAVSVSACRLTPQLAAPLSQSVLLVNGARGMARG